MNITSKLRLNQARKPILPHFKHLQGLYIYLYTSLDFSRESDHSRTQKKKKEIKGIMEKAKRLAVLVGCNYPNTKNELHGCHNDVLAMRDVLINRFQFDPNNIELLTDKPGSSVIPTGANIMKALNTMVDKSAPGDVLYFHYSGHGTLLNKPFLPFIKEEAIVPTDFNLITSKFQDFDSLKNLSISFL